ncbi:MAG: terpene cyclase/mutase family protein [Pirellulales bacterium]
MSTVVNQPNAQPPAGAPAAKPPVPVKAVAKTAPEAAPAVAEMPVSQVGFVGRIKEWFLYDAPAWLISTIVHVVIFLGFALALGGTVIEKVVKNSASFDAADTQALNEPVIERFELGDPQLDPTELDTASLMETEYDPVAQDAEMNDDSPVFEKKGGGSVSTTDSSFGGLGLNIAASGLGPAARGGGGLDGGGGFGKTPGKGGEGGSGFGGRGAGKRAAISGGGTKNTERAVGAALNWIARHQNPDGSWSVDHNKANCKDGVCNGGGSAKADVGATSMALLPFFASGQTHTSKGPYQATIAKGLQYLMRVQKPNGSLASASGHEMYEQGLATICLCEAYGMTQDQKVGYAAQLAIEYVQFAQNPKGGWRYKARAADTDTSVVGWQVMGLKSGIMAGLQVNPVTLEKAKTDLKTASSGYKGGMFGYTPGRGAAPSMTGAGLLCMQYMGVQRDDPMMTEGVGYLMKNQPDEKRRNIYYWYYATQVLHNVPGPEWETWNRKMRRVLVESQERKGCKMGSWDPEGDPWGDNGGRIMVTSLSCLTLEVYYRYLPLYKLDKDNVEKALNN